MFVLLLQNLPMSENQLSSNTSRNKQTPLKKAATGCRSITSFFQTPAAKIPRVSHVESLGHDSCKDLVTEASVSPPALMGMSPKPAKPLSTDTTESMPVLPDLNPITPTGVRWYKSMKLDVTWLRDQNSCLQFYSYAPQGK